MAVAQGGDDAFDQLMIIDMTIDQGHFVFHIRSLGEPLRGQATGFSSRPHWVEMAGLEIHIHQIGIVIQNDRKPLNSLFSYLPDNLSLIDLASNSFCCSDLYRPP